MIPMAEQLASRARLDACGGNRALYTARELERIEAMMAPARKRRMARLTDEERDGVEAAEQVAA